MEEKPTRTLFSYMYVGKIAYALNAMYIIRTLYEAPEESERCSRDLLPLTRSSASGLVPDEVALLELVLSQIILAVLVSA